MKPETLNPALKTSTTDGTSLRNDVKLLKGLQRSETIKFLLLNITPYIHLYTRGLCLKRSDYKQNNYPASGVMSCVVDQVNWLLEEYDIFCFMTPVKFGVGMVTCTFSPFSGC